MIERSRTVEELVSKLTELRRDHYEYMEVKQLAEILARYRANARHAVSEYRSLKGAIAAEKDAIERLYLSYEGMFARDHLRDALRLYVMINRDFHEAYRSYMKALEAEDEAQTASIYDFIAPKVAYDVTKMSQPRRDAA